MRNVEIFSLSCFFIESTNLYNKIIWIFSLSYAFWNMTQSEYCNHIRMILTVSTVFSVPPGKHRIITYKIDKYFDTLKPWLWFLCITHRIRKQLYKELKSHLLSWPFLFKKEPSNPYLKTLLSHKWTLRRVFLDTVNQENLACRKI